MELEEQSEESRRNDRSRNSFERRRDGRLERIGRDENIRRIARSEAQQVFHLMLVIALAYIVKEEYGAVWGGLILVGGWVLLWLKERKTKKLPDYAAEEIDQLAEDAVTHERIIAFDALGKNWLHLEGKYAESDVLFEHPFWETVNKRVTDFERKSHKERQREVSAIKAQTLPIRQAIVAKLRGERDDAEFPMWLFEGIEDRWVPLGLRGTD